MCPSMVRSWKANSCPMRFPTWRIILGRSMPITRRLWSLPACNSVLASEIEVLVIMNAVGVERRVLVREVAFQPERIGDEIEEGSLSDGQFEWIEDSILGEPCLGEVELDGIVPDRVDQILMAHGEGFGVDDQRGIIPAASHRIGFHIEELDGARGLGAHLGTRGRPSDEPRSIRGDCRRIERCVDPTT